MNSDIEKEVAELTEKYSRGLPKQVGNYPVDVMLEAALREIALLTRKKTLEEAIESAESRARSCTTMGGERYIGAASAYSIMADILRELASTPATTDTANSSEASVARKDK